jgi:hypothetical protein
MKPKGIIMNAERKKNRERFIDKIRSYKKKQKAAEVYLELIATRSEALSKGFVSVAGAVDRLMDAFENDNFIPEQSGQLSLIDSTGGEMLIVDEEG